MKKVGSLIKKWYWASIWWKIHKDQKKSYGNFEGKEIPKQDVCCTRLSDILLDSVAREGKKYYLQTRLEECKWKND